MKSFCPRFYHYKSFKNTTDPNPSPIKIIWFGFSCFVRPKFISHRISTKRNSSSKFSFGNGIPTKKMQRQLSSFLHFSHSIDSRSHKIPHHMVVI